MFDEESARFTLSRNHSKFFFEVEVLVSNPVLAKSNLNLHSGNSFPSNLQKQLLVCFGAVGLFNLFYGSGQQVEYLS